MDTYPRGTLDPWFVTGLCEAVATFSAARSGTRRQNVQLFFGMKLAGADDALLSEIRDHFGVGSIYDVPSRGTKYYRVSDLRDLDLVIRHFEEHPLRGSKAAAFEVWREAVRHKQAHFRKAPDDRIDDLLRRLAATGRRGSRASGR